MFEMIMMAVGVVIGAAIALIATSMNNAHLNKKLKQKEEISEKMKEIDTLLLLNRKINEILQRRSISIEMQAYVSFDRFDDCYINFDDYVYLQSFCAQNHYYLPKYIVEEFFKDIAQRQVVLEADKLEMIGGNTYKGGRIVLETFSEELLRCVEDRKIELKQLKEA